MRTLLVIILLGMLVAAGYFAYSAMAIEGEPIPTEGYVALTRVVKEIAGEFCQGRVLSCLEGGYNLEALAASVDGHLHVLMEA